MKKRKVKIEFDGYWYWIARAWRSRASRLHSILVDGLVVRNLRSTSTSQVFPILSERARKSLLSELIQHGSCEEGEPREGCQSRILNNGHALHYRCHIEGQGDSYRTT